MIYVSKVCQYVSYLCISVIWKDKLCHCLLLSRLLSSVPVASYPALGASFDGHVTFELPNIQRSHWPGNDGMTVEQDNHLADGKNQGRFRVSTASHSSGKRSEVVEQ